MAELVNTYNIVQHRLASCQKEKRSIVAKKTAKRALLQESQQVLQNHLVNALTENMTKKKKISLPDNSNRNLVSIFAAPSTLENKHTQPDAKRTPANGFSIAKCRGWIMNRRVWLQAQGHAVLNITQAHIRCLPNKLMPETTCLNKCDTNDEFLQHLFLCFDLLPATQIEEIQSELRMYCSYKLGAQTFSTETCLIEWLDVKNLLWFDSLSIASSQAVLQAYFPCHVSLKNTLQIRDSYQLNQLLDHSQALDTRFLFVQDQQALIHINAKFIDLYALSAASISFILTILNNAELTSLSKETARDLLVSTSEYYVSPNHRTRANVSLVASRLLSKSS